MKFSEYVGHKPTKKIETIIQPKKDVYEEEFYLGFYISKKALKRIYDYMKSWFLRYHIPFKPINPYLTLYLLKNIPMNKKELVDEIKQKKNDVTFSTIDEGSILIVDGKSVEIRLEYTPNNEFLDNIEKIFSDFKIDIVKECCYIKMFELEKVLDEEFLENMMYSCPKFPIIYLENVGIRRK